MKLKDNSPKEIDTALYQLEKKLKGAIDNIEIPKQKLYDDKDIRSALEKEVEDRKASDSNLASKLNTESSNRVEADNVLQNLIEDESSNRVEEDKNLQTNIDRVNSSLTDHCNNTSNPHNVTKAQVGLGNCDNTADKDKSVKFAVSSNYVSVSNNTVGSNTLLVGFSGSTDGFTQSAIINSSDNLEIRNRLVDDVTTKETWYGNDTALMTLQPTGSGVTITGADLTLHNGTITANSFNGKATSSGNSDIPTGFRYRYTGDVWGAANKLGTELTGWRSINNGAVVFREVGDNADKQVYQVIDGFYYQDEGNYKVVDENSIKSLNSGTATKLETPRSISITDGTNTGTASNFDGSGDIKLALPKNNVDINVKALSNSGTHVGGLSYYQSETSYFNSSNNWGSYIICNHGDGQTYYHQMLRFDFFSDNIHLQRMAGGTLKGWNRIPLEKTNNTFTLTNTFSGTLVIPTTASSTNGAIWIG